MDWGDLINSTHKDLIRSPPKKKKVSCLRCGKIFEGSANNRRCAKCHKTITERKK